MSYLNHLRFLFEDFKNQDFPGNNWSFRKILHGRSSITNSVEYLKVKRNVQVHCRCTGMDGAHSFLTGSFMCGILKGKMRWSLWLVVPRRDTHLGWKTPGALRYFCSFPLCLGLFWSAVWILSIFLSTSVVYLFSSPLSRSGNLTFPT